MPGDFFFFKRDSDELEHAQKREALMVGNTKPYPLRPRGHFPWRREDTERAVRAVLARVKSSLVVS